MELFACFNIGANTSIMDLLSQAEDKVIRLELQLKDAAGELILYKLFDWQITFTFHLKMLCLAKAGAQKK